MVKTPETGTPDAAAAKDKGALATVVVKPVIFGETKAAYSIVSCLCLQNQQVILKYKLTCQHR